jgi:type I restriction enzyme S subunit
VSLQTFFDDFALFTAAPGGVARLRKLVLRLAVEGRVVSQDPKEESAEKAIRRAKKTDALLHPAPNEAPFVLPNGWAWLNLADLGTWAIGSGFPTNEQGEKDKRILFCKVSDMNLDGNEKRIIKTQNTIDDEAARRIRAKAHPEGTVVFPKIGGAIATNKRRILTRSTAIDNNCLGIVPSEYCSSDWLYLLLSSIDLMQ